MKTIGRPLEGVVAKSFPKSQNIQDSSNLQGVDS